MYLISGNITSNVTGNLLVITGNGNIGNITSNFRTLLTASWIWMPENVLFSAFFNAMKYVHEFYLTCCYVCQACVLKSTFMRKFRESGQYYWLMRDFWVSTWCKLATSLMQAPLMV